MKKITKLLREKMLLVLLAGLFTASAQAQSVAITGSTIGCIGQPKILGVNITGNLTGPYTYQWSNGATTAAIAILNTGFFRVSVTGTQNGNPLTVTSPWRIFIFFPSPNASISANGPLTFCDSGTVGLTAIGGNIFSSYLWNNGETTQQIIVSQSGTYYCTITQLSGCSSTTNSVVVDILDPGFVPTVTASGPLTFCQPGSVTLTASPGFGSYLWTNGATTQATTVTLVGSGGPILDTLSISCTVSNASCSFSSKTVVVRSIRQPELEAPYCPNLNMTLSDTVVGGIVLKYLGVPPGYEFEFEETTNPGTTWVVNNGTSRHLALNDVTPVLEAGKFYNVRERAVINGISYCYGDPCVIGVTGPVVDPNTGQKMASSGNIEIGVFPNPSSDQFTVNVLTGTTQSTEVRLVDMAGRIIENAQLGSGQKTIQVGKNLVAGVYLVQVSQGSESTFTRIIKTN
jgi:hypothetical protein